jgi:hypothetical protein
MKTNLEPRSVSRRDFHRLSVGALDEFGSATHEATRGESVIDNDGQKGGSQPAGLPGVGARAVRRADYRGHGLHDHTKEIAAQCGAKVYDFPRVDSVATARDEALRHVGGDLMVRQITLAGDLGNRIPIL